MTMAGETAMRRMPVAKAPDGDMRCQWALSAPGFLDYHDGEWGMPVKDERRLFEKLSLEAFQSGLSWRTILDKRENFRKAFSGFDSRRIAAFSDADVRRLLEDKGIVRHRGKIEAVINNARRLPRPSARGPWLASSGRSSLAAEWRAMGRWPRPQRSRSPCRNG